MTPMRVLVDGEPHPFVHAGTLSVEAIVAEIDEVLEHRGRGIVQVAVNGEPWPLDRLERELRHLSPADIQRLDVTTESIHVLLEQSLAEVAAVIDELPSACHSLAAVLSGADRDEALASYADLIDIWEELLERHREILDTLRVKSSTVSIEGDSLEAWQVRVLDVLQRGQDLARTDDTVGLADLVTHELVPFAESESVVLEQLHALIRAAHSGQ